MKTVISFATFCTLKAIFRNACEEDPTQDLNLINPEVENDLKCGSLGEKDLSLATEALRIESFEKGEVILFCTFNRCLRNLLWYFCGFLP